jgi:hypothetical protein
MSLQQLAQVFGPLTNHLTEQLTDFEWNAGASYFTSSTTSKELIQTTPPNEYWSGISSSFPITSPLPDDQEGGTKYETIYDILRKDDLYDVLSITPDVADDLSALRRAYLARSRHCHPESV